MDDRKSRLSPFRIHLGATRLMAVCLFVATGVLLSNANLHGDQPQWIWSPMKSVVGGINSQGECYYRKKFTLIRPVKAEMELAAGDEYEIFINGQLATRGQSFGSPTKLDVGSFLQPGVNLVAAKVRHHEGSFVGLAMRLRVLEKGETRYRSLMTDQSWKTRMTVADTWKSTAYNDMGWLKAQTLGELGSPSTTTPNQSAVATNPAYKDRPSPGANKKPFSLASQSTSTPAASTNDQATPTQPQDVSTKRIALTPEASQNPTNANTTQVQPPNQEASGKPAGKPVATAEKEARFEIDDEFEVQQVFASSETGSLVAMEFNEFGQVLLSVEGGPLLIADPAKALTDPQRVRVYCDQVNTCQGILPLNGSVYVTGQGPEGLGLYLLSDDNRDGKLEVKRKLVGFTGELGEHGPHGIQLGPDGMLYVVIGNGSQVDAATAITSPYQDFYEGDLVPRYEDPGGHAKGVKAPGGTIIRLSLDGKKIETVAGGIRNAYDLVFDHQGELFLHDSDMESDIGTSWYRPTMIYHVPAGAEFGWRSGWAKFPKHFVDQTPAVCETGRGSPAGAVLYQHLQFPVRYQDTMFFADWSEGRILALRQQPEGAGFTATAETFLKGRPLNVVDLAVGEDGGLYFCTGGRGTAGGVFRIVWKGDVPEHVLEFESELAKAIRHPQPNSAWARQNIAELKISMGENWNTAIRGVAKEKRNTNKLRVRALQLMVLYGPAPDQQLLETLSKDDSPEVRAQIARLCGLRKNVVTESVLKQLVADASPMVSRIAGESMMRQGMEPELSVILPMLGSLDRTESLTGRRLIERIPVERWESEVFTTENKRLFIQGAVALMTAEPSLERAYKVLARASTFMEGFVNDHDFVDMLRAMELALVRGKVNADRIPGLVVRMGNEFPSGNSTINQELARIMAYLKAGDLQGRGIEYLNNEDVSLDDKVHFAMYMQAVGSQLTPGMRLAIIDTLEQAQHVEGSGGSYALYLQQAVKDVAQSITADQVNTILENGDRWPNAVVAAFYKMPDNLDEETVQRVIAMDQAIQQSGKTDPATEQMRLGVIAVLARSGDESSMEYLRQLWQNEVNRRNDIVIGLSQQPAAENWAYLVSSLPVLDDLTGKEVVEKLTAVPRRPRDPRHFRELISVGYRLRGQDKDAIIRLLEHWSGETVELTGDDWQSKLNQWRNWFHQKWPDQGQINVEEQTETVGKHSVDQLLGKLDSIGPGNALMGHAVYLKAQCANCHQMEGIGQAVGPDLTNLASRFSIREAIESTIDPSKVIPDRYASKTILTTDGIQFSGMAIEQADGSVFVLQSDGKRVRIAANDVEVIKPNSTSAMPEGLLDNLSDSEIANLFAFLLKNKPAPSQQAQATPARRMPEGPQVSQSEFEVKR